MRGQSLIGLIEYEARIKPHVKELLDRAEHLSDSEIENAVVPLPWFKIALRQVRAHRIALNISQAALETVVDDPLGNVCVYQGDDTFIPLSKNGYLEIKNGMIVWFPTSGGVWVDTIFIANIPLELNTVVRGEQVTKTQYTNLLRSRRNKLYGN